MKSVWLSLGLVFSMSLALGSFAHADEVTEPETKVKFTDTWSNDGMTYALAGVGVREKLSFDVYACGLYIEKSQGGAALKSWIDGAGKAYNVNGKVDTEKAKTDQKTFNQIINGNYGRAMWLKMVRSVSGPKIKDGFIESLSKNLDVESADVKADVEKLAAFLSGAEAVKGGEYKFFFAADGTLTGKGPGGTLSIKNEKLARGFLSVWIGSKPITTALRASLIGEINNLLK